MFHVHFLPAARLGAVLNAPTTSYLKIEGLQAGKSAADVDGALAGLLALRVEDGNYGGVAGRAVEKDERVMLFGWDDPEVRCVL